MKGEPKIGETTSANQAEKTDKKTENPARVLYKILEAWRGPSGKIYIVDSLANRLGIPGSRVVRLMGKIPGFEEVMCGGQTTAYRLRDRDQALDHLRTIIGKEPEKTVEIPNAEEPREPAEEFGGLAVKPPLQRTEDSQPPLKKEAVKSGEPKPAPKEQLLKKAMVIGYPPAENIPVEKSPEARIENSDDLKRFIEKKGEKAEISYRALLSPDESLIYEELWKKFGTGKFRKSESELKRYDRYPRHQRFLFSNLEKVCCILKIPNNENPTDPYFQLIPPQEKRMIIYSDWKRAVFLMKRPERTSTELTVDEAEIYEHIRKSPLPFLRFGSIEYRMLPPDFFEGSRYSEGRKLLKKLESKGFLWRGYLLGSTIGSPAYRAN